MAHPVVIIIHVKPSFDEQYISVETGPIRIMAQKHQLPSQQTAASLRAVISMLRCIDGNLRSFYKRITDCLIKLNNAKHSPSQ